MTHPDRPTPDSIGVPKTTKNLQIIAVIFDQVNSQICNDNRGGVLNIVQKMQGQRMIALKDVNLWGKPKLEEIMQSLGFVYNDTAFESSVFNINNSSPPSLVIAGFDHFLKANKGNFKSGSPNDAILQILSIADKWSKATHITFEKDDYSNALRLSEQSNWSRNLLLDHAAIQIIH
jgi:hypothetical protein